MPRGCVFCRITPYWTVILKPDSSLRRIILFTSWWLIVTASYSSGVAQSVKWINNNCIYVRKQEIYILIYSEAKCITSSTQHPESYIYGTGYAWYFDLNMFTVYVSVTEHISYLLSYSCILYNLSFPSYCHCIGNQNKKKEIRKSK